MTGATLLSHRIRAGHRHVNDFHRLVKALSQKTGFGRHRKQENAQDVATLLLAKGADVNAKSKDGATPLRVAVK